MAGRSIHDVRADAFEYAWDNSVEPALEIESGEAVQLHVRDASDEQIGPGSSAADVLELDFSHVNPVSGPVYVKGAEPGPHPILPPSRYGGNMDVKHLNPGVTLYLPVGVEGALFALGDTHAAQGDGEVCGTAIETAMDVVVRLTVRKDLRVEMPQYDVPAGLVGAHEQSGYHVCTGVGPDLMEAARDAVRATIAHLEEHRGLDREEAYAVASVAADLRIHEIVDAPNWVVGAFVPDSIFEPRG